MDRPRQILRAPTQPPPTDEGGAPTQPSLNIGGAGGGCYTESWIIILPPAMLPQRAPRSSPGPTACGSAGSLRFGRPANPQASRTAQDPTVAAATGPLRFGRHPLSNCRPSFSFVFISFNRFEAVRTRRLTGLWRPVASCGRLNPFKLTQ